jgi:Na+-translocating ferredoxin:NAD+ oxidoreductase RnfG subunit
MRRRCLIKKFAPALLLAPGGLHAQAYLSREQARSILLPGASEPRSIPISKKQRRKIEQASGVAVVTSELDAWRHPDGSWLIFDTVEGRYEAIDIAVAVSGAGEVLGVEILTYRESYGYEVRSPKWRRQFHGKTAGSKLKLDKDITNISGATISSQSITKGVKRLLHTWELVLRHLPNSGSTLS